MASLLVEAILSGILLIVLGVVISYIIMHSRTFIDNPKICNDWNSRLPYIVIGMFLLGFLGHLLCEVTGLNKWYCKHGHACRR